MKQPKERLFGDPDRCQTRDYSEVACDPEASRMGDPLAGDEQDIGDDFELSQRPEHRRKLSEA